MDKFELPALSSYSKLTLNWWKNKEGRLTSTCYEGAEIEVSFIYLWLSLVEQIDCLDTQIAHSGLSLFPCLRRWRVPQLNFYISRIIFTTVCLICSSVWLLILIAKKSIYHQESNYKNNINKTRQLAFCILRQF